jgi:hypothetical protein
LAKFGDNNLLVAAASVRRHVHECAFGVQVEAPGTKERHLLRKHVPHLDYLSGFDKPNRPEHCFRFHVIARSPLVARPPFRGATLIIGWWPPRLSVGGGASPSKSQCYGDANGNRSHLFSSFLWLGKMIKTRIMGINWNGILGIK